MTAPAAPWRWLQTAIAQAATTLDNRRTFTAHELLDALRLHNPALLRGINDSDALALTRITFDRFPMPQGIVGDLLIAYQQLPEGASGADEYAMVADVLGTHHRLTGAEREAIVEEFRRTLVLWGKHALLRASNLESSV